MQPGVITFRPDNLLTVGLLGAIAYVAAVLLVQLAMRAGLLSSGPAAAPVAAPPAGAVAAG